MVGINKNRSGSLTEQVVRHLIAQIESGTPGPGEKLLSEAVIAEREGVSRTVVREAISRLQARNLVETRHGVGTFVCKLDGKLDGLMGSNLKSSRFNTVDDVLAILGLRIAVETEAAALAAVRRQEDHLEAMQQSLAALADEMRSGRSGVKPDFQFHLGIARATGNRYFVELLSNFGERVIPRSRFQIAESYLERQEYLRRIHNEHEDIYHAILRRDPETARAAVRNHLSNSCARMKRAIEAQGANGG